MTIATRPSIGDVKSAREIGKSGTHWYIWVACSDCGKERWVMFLRGKPRRRFCRECQLEHIHKCNRGENHPQWKGGKRAKTRGYISLWKPDHPYCDAEGYVSEHRLIMEQTLGRYLLPKEVIHHIDGNPQNNNPANLSLFSSAREHASFHMANGDYHNIGVRE